MTLEDTLLALQSLGSDRTKKIYMSNGAREPLFGVATGAMKPLYRKIGRNQPLAEQLYATGNYDAMYFAGMIADPEAMTEVDFDRWIEAAYFYMVSDYIVAVTLAEAGCAQCVADRWIDSDRELTQSAGWACYEWLLGFRPDSAFSAEKVMGLIARVAQTIHQQPGRVKHSMNNFIQAVGVSYLPLHEEAVEAAQRIGNIQIDAAKGVCALPSALEAIQKAKGKGRLGFKRKAVRC